MKKNEVYEVTIDDISTDGEGIGHIAVNDSRITIFVKDTVMGDRIKARIIKVKKTYVYGRLEQLLIPSPYRVEARCRNARSCGGCTLMHMTYDKQLEYKWNTVKNCLIRIGGFNDIEEKMESICGMEYPYEYRNKMQFPVGVDKDGKVVIGFYAGHTHSIIDLNRCEIGHPVNNYILKELRPWLQKWQDIKTDLIYREVTHTGLLRHILIRVGYATGEVMVCFVVNGTDLPEGTKEELVGILKKAVNKYNHENQKLNTCRLASVIMNTNQDKTNKILGETCGTLYGSSYITDYIGDVEFRISALSFYQVNPVQTKVLYDKAVDYAGLTGQEIVWDMYCGIGTISLNLARKAGKVYGVEIVPQAIEDAKKNAEINGIANVEFYCGKAEEVVPEFYQNYYTQEKNAINDGFCMGLTENGDIVEKNNQLSCTHPDVIVVDPPRKGCDPGLLSTILAMAPERIVYVSCNPSTLARDLKILTESEYSIQKVGVVDQFCHSVHVECVAKLHRVNS
ncbi:MAG: 23S rRNA (uracil(1939)-C(5))-methyltransferase RlmD [Lachnospiraceae bacterium]|nr:23S rRNA (uracil(1939)-C(5))-methyltransferase RlmD [Lachnospiraceae bacterium]